MKNNFLLFLLCLLPYSLHAFELRGFFTTGISFSDNKNQLYRFSQINEDISYLSDSVAGLQFDFEVSDQTKIIMQAVAKNNNDHFDVSMDWLYITHQLSSHTTFRGGRILLPLFLRSSTIDVGLSYPWIRPPAEVYELGLFKGMGGVDLLFKTSMLEREVLLHPFAGEISEELATSVLPGGDVSITSEALWGIESRVLSRYGETRVAYMNADVQLELDPSFSASVDVLTSIVSSLGTLAPPSATAQLSLLGAPISADSSFTSIGGHYLVGNVEILWEAANRRISFAGGGASKTRGYYVTLMWDHDKYQPTLTLARRDEHPASDSASPAQEQDSITLGIQRRLDHKILVKTEISNVHPRNGTAGLLVNNTLAGEGDLTVFNLAVNAQF